MTELWENSLVYKVFRPYIDYCTRYSFRKIEVVGAPPQFDGAVVVASNHTNTLLDPLLVMLPYPDGIVFGARADVFRRPGLARFFHNIKMVPLARKERERPEEVARNVQTFGEIDKALSHGIPFGIFPEGRHRTMHSLQPMRRGVAGIAFRSAAQRPTIILPVGLDYSDYFNYRGLVRVWYGEPIDVNALAEEIARQDSVTESHTTESARDAALQQLLYERLSRLIFFLPDDATYEDRLAEAKAARRPRHRALKIVQAIISFPLFVLCAALSLPMWALAEYICRWKIKDPAFQNTARFGVKMLVTPLLFIIWAVVFFLLLPWWAAAGLLILFIHSYSVFYDWTGLLRGLRRGNEPLWK